MRISTEKLVSEAQSTGFRPEILEKALQIVSLLDLMLRHPFLKDRLVLKGGTALNLFIFPIPRLSVDLDLNYVGAVERQGMLQERPKVEEAMRAVFAREGLAVRRMPGEHAGGKWQLRYSSASGGSGNLEVDLNFMFRIPLWPVAVRHSQPLGSCPVIRAPILDIHELAAGKLAALLARRQARDLFDVHRLLSLESMDGGRLRIAFVVYGAMNRVDWRSVSPEQLSFEPEELARQLVPTLRSGSMQAEEAEFGHRLVDECREALSVVLPFTESEMEFFNLVLDRGEVEPSLLTADTELQDRIRRHPLLQWKAGQVREHRGQKPKS